MSVMWILVADSARARLFALADGGREPEEIEDFVNAEGRLGGRGQERDHLPRSHDRFGAGRHAIEPHTSHEEKAMGEFVRLLGAALERGRVQRRYSDLVLIAPPHMLGVLKAELNKHVRAYVVKEIGKELTHADAKTIGDELPESLRRRA